MWQPDLIGLRNVCISETPAGISCGGFCMLLRRRSRRGRPLSVEAQHKSDGGTLRGVAFPSPGKSPKGRIRAGCPYGSRWWWIGNFPSYRSALCGISIRPALCSASTQCSDNWPPRCTLPAPRWAGCGRLFCGCAPHLRSVRGRPSAGGEAPLKMSVREGVF